MKKMLKSQAVIVTLFLILTAVSYTPISMMAGSLNLFSWDMDASVGFFVWEFFLYFSSFCFCDARDWID